MLRALVIIALLAVLGLSCGGGPVGVEAETLAVARIDTMIPHDDVGDTMWSARWDGSGRIPLAVLDSTGLYVPICPEAGDYTLRPPVGRELSVNGELTRKDATGAYVPIDWYAAETYKLIDSLMSDYANVRDFTIDGEGASCIVTLVDSDFMIYAAQGPRPTWHKLVHEVVEEWKEGR